VPVNPHPLHCSVFVDPLTHILTVEDLRNKERILFHVGEEFFFDDTDTTESVDYRFFVQHPRS